MKRTLGKLPPIKRREIPFERRLQVELKKYGVLFVKLKPTLRGFPDRLAMGYGRIGLVEIKREDGELSDVQKTLRKMLREKYRTRVLVVRGPNVRDGARKIDAWLRR